MKCVNCGAELLPGDRFCPSCGALHPLLAGTPGERPPAPPEPLPGVPPSTPSAPPTGRGPLWGWIAAGCGGLLIFAVVFGGGLVVMPSLLPAPTPTVTPMPTQLPPTDTPTRVLPTRKPSPTKVPTRPASPTPTTVFAPSETSTRVPPTKTSSPTQAPAKPVAPTPTVGLASFGCPGTKGNSLFFDDFGDPESGWTDYRGADYEHFYKDGEFHFRIWRTNSTGNAWMLLRDLGTRYSMEVQAWKHDGLDMNDYGLLFGGQDDKNYYTFFISDSGSYRVAKKVEGEWVGLKEWTKTPFVNKGGVNYLGLKVDDTQITVCLNGQTLVTVGDPALKSGRVGMVAGAFDEPVHIHFDSFGVWRLD